MFIKDPQRLTTGRCVLRNYQGACQSVYLSWEIIHFFPLLAIICVLKVAVHKSLNTGKKYSKKEEVVKNGNRICKYHLLHYLSGH